MGSYIATYIAIQMRTFGVAIASAWSERVPSSSAQYQRLEDVLMLIIRHEPEFMCNRNIVYAEC